MQTQPGTQIDIAVLIPCFNEEAAIADVVGAFRDALPASRIYVYDNNSTDRTVAVARAAGAIVHGEARQGKGNVVRRMFADIEAEVYVLVDGDNTYEAAAAPRLVDKLIDDSLDMVTGCRASGSRDAYRRGHRFGNWMLTWLVALIFGKRTDDLLSGYRVFSRRFVKSFPALSRGFEIETELTVHALELRMPIADVDTVYVERPAGSESKLSTIADGLRIVRTIVALVKEERPWPLFGLISAGLAGISVVLGYSLIVEFVATGLVPRLPTAVLSASIMILAVLAFFAGLILDSVTHGRREMKRLAYLRYAAPARAAPAAVLRAETDIALARR